MFAIIENGSRQHRVQAGDTLRIDFQSEVEKGATVTFDKVLLANGGAGSVVGKPTIAGATVTAEVMAPLEKGDKLEIGKFRKRKNSKRHTGHRQKYTRVKITGISVPGIQEA
jgi:large subunit ribosomal protein L21